MIKKNIKYADILIIVIYQVKQLATLNMKAIRELREMDLRKASDFKFTERNQFKCRPANEEEACWF